MSENAPPQPRQFIQTVIIDWNILHYWMSKKMRDAITPVMTEIDAANLRYSVSEISVYEAQCTMPIGKHLESVKFLKNFPTFPVNTNTWLLTGAVVCCYKDHESTKAHASSISLQDRINAAAAILNNALVLTADYNDYPRPFFNEIALWDITNERGRSQKIYLLAPDINQFTRHIEKWVTAQQPNAEPVKEFAV